MKLVIDIPKDMYESIKQLKIQYPRGSAKANQLDFYYGLLNCLKQGIPIPKGHGRLIDADELIKQLEATANIEWNQQVGSSKGLEDAIDIVDNAPTIIEADKEEQEWKF